MKRVLTLCLALCATLAFSQEKPKPAKDNNLTQGNKQFDDKEYAEAEASYRISKSNNPTSAASAYNLGNAIYRQKKPGEAQYAYSKAIEIAKDKPQKHQAWHNMGNALMAEKNYQGAVEAYKNALRNDPTDDESRYNYALAKEMLKNNPPPPQPKDKDKDKDKDKKDDKSQKPKDKGDNKDKGGEGDQKDKGDKKEKPDDKNKGDEKDNKDKGDQKDKQNGDGKDKKDNADPQPSNASPSKQRMENMLDAMNNEEKKVQDKLNAKRTKAQPKRVEKDW